VQDTAKELRNVKKTEQDQPKQMLYGSRQGEKRSKPGQWQTRHKRQRVSVTENGANPATREMQSADKHFRDGANPAKIAIFAKKNCFEFIQCISYAI
jgi:hypothetical protein